MRRGRHEDGRTDKSLFVGLDGLTVPEPDGSINTGTQGHLILLETSRVIINVRRDGTLGDWRDPSSLSKSTFWVPTTVQRRSDV